MKELCLKNRTHFLFRFFVIHRTCRRSPSAKSMTWSPYLTDTLPRLGTHFSYQNFSETFRRLVKLHGDFPYIARRAATTQNKRRRTCCSSGVSTMRRFDGYPASALSSWTKTKSKHNGRALADEVEQLLDAIKRERKKTQQLGRFFFC